MLPLSNMSNKDLGKLFESLFSEEVTVCECGRVLSVDGEWKYPETAEEWQRIRKAGKFEYCPYCMKQTMLHA